VGDTWFDTKRKQLFVKVENSGIPKTSYWSGVSLKSRVAREHALREREYDEADAKYKTWQPFKDWAFAILFFGSIFYAISKTGH
jgi:hypothetical protein